MKRLFILFMNLTFVMCLVSCKNDTGLKPAELVFSEVHTDSLITAEYIEYCMMNIIDEKNEKRNVSGRIIEKNEKGEITKTEFNGNNYVPININGEVVWIKEN